MGKADEEMEREKVRALVAQMTLEEKASLCSGEDFWRLKGIARLGIPQVMVSDGPHGLRKQDGEGDHLGVNDSIKAVCFPAGCASASSWDKELLERIGQALGQECQAEGISTVLGPAMNIKRSPLCGRNFEYYSEDPLLSTRMAGSFIQGVQSRNVGTSAKHFLANNQEFHRMTSSSDVDERALREIYLASFEGAVRCHKPWTVMNSYNRLNGTYVGESREYLTDILRDEWGFDGYVVTDWGAVNDRVEALKAGVDLEMPGSGGVNDRLIVEAVRAGTLEEKMVDQACERILDIVFRYVENQDKDAVFDYEGDHELAKKAAEESMVLLKNEGHILPLSPESRVAFIGKYAETPRYQGGGSSHINSFRVESALEAVKGIAQVTYAKGFEDDKDQVDEALLAEAVDAAAAAQVAVVFAGLPDNFESEGYDRKHMQMPQCQNRLINEICKVQPNVVVVLHNGSPVEMPWADRVKGILEAYLGGQAVGGAVVDILYGIANPSGRLAETFPLRLEDTPCYLTYGGENDHSRYTEGIFVGYRYYCSKKMQVLFPFGYGLSYTSFAYDNLKLDRARIKDTDVLRVTVDVTNTGESEGKEVVQLYVAPSKGKVIRPVRELRDFTKISLQPGESKTVEFTLDKRSFAYWDEQIHDWAVEMGCVSVQICRNAQEVLLEQEVFVESTMVRKKIYHMNSTLGEIMADPKGMEILGGLWGDQGEEQAAQAQNSDAINDEMMDAMTDGMPLRQLISFVPGMTWETLGQLLESLNG